LGHIFKNILAIDDAYSPISGCIDTSQARNKTLTIWLLHIVYCRLLTAFVCPPQAIEDEGVGKQLYSIAE